MKDAYYFSHDSNAKNDTKILAMRSDYGMQGYGMYWVIVETLRDEADYTLSLHGNTIKALAMQMNMEYQLVDKFIKDCIDVYELFESDENTFWSESLLRRMQKLEDIREKRKSAINKRWDKQNNDDVIQNEYKCITSVIQLDTKESKVKESKIYSSDLQADTEPKIVFNHLSEKWENIQDKHIDNWIKAYPACDIPTELARMKQWILANGAKGHKSNWLKFIINWLSRTQDRGGSFKN